MTVLLSLKQVSEMLGQTPAWVNRQAYLKRIAYQRFGRVKMFLPEDVQEFIRKTRVEATSAWPIDAKTPKDGGSVSMIQSPARGSKGTAAPPVEKRKFSKKDLGLVN